MRQMDQWADELFIEEVDKPKWVRHVKGVMEGLGCTITPLPPHVVEARRSVSRYTQGFDIMANGKLLEVGCRRLEFTGPSDFPHDEIRIGPVYNFRKMRHPPFSIMYVSRFTEAVISLRVSTMIQWQTVRDYDFTRGCEADIYFADKGMWQLVGGE